MFMAFGVQQVVLAGEALSGTPTCAATGTHVVTTTLDLF